jgi:predicted MPP superfamily phosphohydrolase
MQAVNLMSRFALIALALHLPLFVYPLTRLVMWLDVSLPIALVTLVPLISSQPVSRVWLRGRREMWALAIRRIADFLLGVSFVLLSLVLVGEVVLVLSNAAPARVASLIVAVTIAAGVMGVVVASFPAVVTVPLQSTKVDRLRRFVQITDVHIGSRSPRFLERIILRINLLDPEMLFITGDFIDETGITPADLRSLQSLNCPVCFSIGNHEKYEDLEAICERLAGLGVKVLRNRSWRQAGVQVIGVDDMDDAQQVQKRLAEIPVSPADYVVLLYHRPRGLEAAADAGVDLMLSGHTHNGQIVPFNLLVRRVFDRTRGLFTIGSTHLYVSQGTGTWGPVMRMGTRSEITLLEVSPATAA